MRTAVAFDGIPEIDGCDTNGVQLDALRMTTGHACADADDDADGICDDVDDSWDDYDECGTHQRNGHHRRRRVMRHTQRFYDCDGNCLNDADSDGVCDELEIDGCTDSGACNYDAGATDRRWVMHLPMSSTTATDLRTT